MFTPTLGFYWRQPNVTTEADRIDQVFGELNGGIHQSMERLHYEVRRMADISTTDLHLTIGHFEFYCRSFLDDISRLTESLSKLSTAAAVGKLPSHCDNAKVAQIATKLLTWIQASFVNLNTKSGDGAIADVGVKDWENGQEVFFSVGDLALSPPIWDTAFSSRIVAEFVAWCRSIVQRINIDTDALFVAMGTVFTIQIDG